MLIGPVAKASRIRGRKLQERRARYLAANPLCKHCMAKGRVTAAQQVDHVIPLHKGGADCFDTNGQGLCVECHKAKTAQDMGHKRVSVGVDGWPMRGRA